MGSKKLQVWLPVLFALVMIVGMGIGFKLREKTADVGSFFRLKKKNSIQEILDLVQSKYVDKIGTDSLTEMAIEELLSHLDPHSVYIPAEKLKFENEDLQGNFQGVG